MPNKFDREEETIEYELNLTSKFSYLRPAIGYYSNLTTDEDIAYFVLWLPTNIRKENGGQITDSNIRNLPWMITEDGKRIRWDLKELQMFRLFPSSDVAQYSLRWGLDDLQSFFLKQESYNPHEIFQKIVEKLKFNIEFLDQRYYLLVAAWIIGTYFHQTFQSYPFLYFGGLKRVGKTKSLRFTEMLTFNSVNSLSVSASALFRLCQGGASTLLIDETGYLMNRQRHEDLRTLLYGRYKKGQTVQRVEKTSQGHMYVQEYEVYGPTALANIEGLEDVLAERAIQIILIRTLNRTIANREINPDDPDWQIIRNVLYRMYLMHWKETRETYNDLAKPSIASNGQTPQTEQTDEQKNGDSKTADETTVSGVSGVTPLLPMEGINLTGRSFELWKPILAIAKWIDHSHNGEEKIFQPILDLAHEMEEERKTEDLTSTGESALVLALLKLATKDNWYTVKLITEKTIEEFEGDHLDWLNNKWIGRCMKRIGFKEKRKLGTSIQYRLTPGKVRDVALRFGFPMNINSITPQTPQTVTSAGEGQKEILIICKNCSLDQEPNPKGIIKLDQYGICELCGNAADLYRVIK